MKYYTGIGSRTISPSEYTTLVYIGKTLKGEGWTVRSGGADGSDSAFGEADPEGDHFVPWRDFAKLKGLHEINVNQFQPKILERANQIASEYHPIWNSLKPAVQLLHARNVFQILGHNLDNPSKFVVLCADQDKNGVKGGTGQSVRLARSLNIPCFNIRIEEDLIRIQKWLTKVL